MQHSSSMGSYPIIEVPSMHHLSGGPAHKLFPCPSREAAEDPKGPHLKIPQVVDDTSINQARETREREREQRLPRQSNSRNAATMLSLTLSLQKLFLHLLPLFQNPFSIYLPHTLSCSLYFFFFFFPLSQNPPNAENCNPSSLLLCNPISNSSNSIREQKPTLQTNQEGPQSRPRKPAPLQAQHVFEEMRPQRSSPALR